MAGEYPNSTWWEGGAPSGNYTAANRPQSGPINKVIVHTVQGRYYEGLNWFDNPDSNVSAHYTVSRTGDVYQSISERHMGHHAGNSDYNATSIGIEHEGFTSEPGYWYTTEMYRASARLTAYLCKKYGIAVDRQRIIGHNEVPDPYEPGKYGGFSNHTDPGSGWDWTRYLDLVRSYAGSSPSSANTYSQVVDNGTSGRFSANGSVWGTSAYNSQRVGANYRYTRPKGRQYFASWKVRVPARDAYDVYVRHPADSGYNSRAAYRVRTVNGWKAKTVDQRSGGGRWKKLGRYTLAKGDAYWVRLSSTSSGNDGYIVADAVRIVRR